jgi:ankyrin repeat protein
MQGHLQGPSWRPASTWTPIGAVLCLILLSAVRSTAGPLDLRLVEAVQARDTTAVSALLKQRVDVNVTQPDGATALHWAAHWDDLTTADLLIRAKAKVDVINAYGVTPLSLAATNGSAAMVQKLVAAGANPNRTTPSGETPLLTAARTGKVDAVRALLAGGASVNVTEPAFGQTPLMWAVAEGHVETARALVDAGVDIHARSKNGFTALLFAVREGQLETLGTLVAAGANVNDRSSAVALAIINARYDIGVWLLEHGADARVQDPRGSLLHTLAWMRRPGKNAAPRLHKLEPAGTPDSLDLAKALLAHGADPNVRITWEERKPRSGNAISFAYARSPGNMEVGISFMSFVGATPFYLAARSGDVALMRVLVANGANPLTPTEKGVTPLMTAAGVGYYNGQSPGPEWGGVMDSEVLEALNLTWELGNDVNAVTHDEVIPPDARDPAYALDHPTGQFDLRWGRSTALHGAILRETLPFLQFLIDKGARLDATNQLGWTPLSVAMGIYTGGTFRTYPATSEFLRQVMKQRGLDPSASIVCTICGPEGITPVRANEK